MLNTIHTLLIRTIHTNSYAGFRNKMKITCNQLKWRKKQNVASGAAFRTTVVNEKMLNVKHVLSQFAFHPSPKHLNSQRLFIYPGALEQLWSFSRIV